MSGVDMTVLHQLAEDIAPDDLRLVLKAFEDDMRRLSQAMEDAAMAADLSGFHRSAHALAGAAGAVGAVELERSARAALTLAEPDRTAATAVRAEAHEAVTVLRHFAAADRTGA